LATSDLGDIQVAERALQRKTGARGLRSIMENVLLDTMYRIPSEEHVVKVVVDQQGFALYFSRSPIPYVQSFSLRPRYYKHIGPYAYRMGFLLTLTRLPRGILEQIESLEQLRVLERKGGNQTAIVTTGKADACRALRRHRHGPRRQ